MRALINRQAYELSALCSAIRFLYCEEVDLTTACVMDILIASRRYKVPSLATRCHQFINDRLTDSDVCSMLDQCIVANETDLANSCLAYIKHHTSAVIASQSFLESSPESYSTSSSRRKRRPPRLNFSRRASLGREVGARRATATILTLCGDIWNRCCHTFDSRRCHRKISLLASFR
jgi:hypothetical protein